MDKIFMEIFVSPNGNDNGLGTKDMPFATLKRAKEEVIAKRDNMDGDILVNIAPGYYQLTETQIFDESCSGKNGYNVIFRGSDRDNPPLFSGGTKISGWSIEKDGKIWSAPTEIKKMRTLYINGLPAQRAVSKYLYEPIDFYHEEGSTHFADGIIASAENFFADFEHPEELEVVWPLLWTLQRTPATALIKKDDKIIIKLKQPCFDFGRTKEFSGTNPGATNEAGAEKKRFYLENAKELLDEPGEFYFSKTEGRVYYYPFPEEDLNTSEVYAGTTEFMVKIKGSNKNNKIKNIVFDNLDFRYGAWNGVTEEGLISTQADLLITEVNGLVAHKGKPLPAQLEILNAENVEIKNCRISSMGSSAISLCDGVKNSRIIGNRIMDISGTGIMVDHWDHMRVVPDNMERCENLLISNNVIHRAATEFRGMTAISLFFPKNTEISHNDIKNVPYTGISFGWGWGAEDILDASDNYVQYNRIEDVTDVTHDGAHIYTLDTLHRGKIRGNYLIKSGEYRGGVYLDSGTRDVEITDNVMENSEQWLFARAFVGLERIVAYGNFYEEGTYAELDYVHVTQYDNIEAPRDENGKTVWPKKAQEIMAFAGLDAEYTHLLEGTELPPWRKDVLDYQPMSEFLSEKNAWVNSIDFIKGAGEGSGYHTVSGRSVRIQSDCYGSILNETSVGDWLKYDVYVRNTDEYDIQFKTTDIDTVVKVKPKINFYIDGKLVLEAAELPNTGYWLDEWRRLGKPYPIHTIGKVKLEKGSHTIKIEFVDNTTSFEAWRFYNERILDGIIYDEGIIK